ncbi:MAG: hypothetical protein DDT23_00373 [candidate division WS2 bacterium]|nr:hypothetical protein [Candidatus Lithacetigena glycinireducens]
MSKYYTLEEVRAIRDKISQLGERSSPELDVQLEKARAEYSKAKAEWGRVYAEWNKARAEWDVQLFTLLVQICPEGYYRDWAGYLAIPQDKSEDWIIPVFAGDYVGVQHKAFSIWDGPYRNAGIMRIMQREVADE